MKILIVDDEVVFRDLLEDMLQPYGTIITANDGLEAVNLFQKSMDSENPFDLVMLDINMPKMDGQQALKQIRQLEKQKYGVSLDLKEYAIIIMQTSLDHPIHLIEAFQQGHCNGYIMKPVKQEEMVEKLKRHHLI